MKSETQVRKQLLLLQEDLKWWQARREQPNSLDVPSSLERTIAGVEGEIKSLDWILREH